MSGDADIRLLNGSGTEIGSSIGIGNASDSITQTLNAGNYYVKVNAPLAFVGTALPKSTDATNYTLRLSTPLTASAESDFTGDGKPDLILQNQAAGWAGVWSGITTTSLSATTDTATPQSWLGFPTTSGGTISGIADLNNNGKKDIILQNQAAGWAGIWLDISISNNAVQPAAWIALPSTGGGKIVGTTDVNNNGKVDIILQNKAAGWAGIWADSTIVNNTLTPGSWIGLTGTSGADIVGAADFDGDGKEEIILQNQAAGWAGIWAGITITNGFLTPSRWVALPSTAGAQIKGASDITGDGKADIILQSSAGWAGAWKNVDLGGASGVAGVEKWIGLGSATSGGSIFAF
jgi:hypothetical protein